MRAINPPNDLQNLIRLRGLNARIIAKAIGLGHPCVVRTIQGTRNSREVRAKIAEYLGLNHRRVWTKQGMSAAYLGPFIVEAVREKEVRAKAKRYAQRLGGADER
jgi:hypothetical protein